MSEDSTVEPDKALGCMLGIAVGDALGFPVEGLSRKRARRRFGHIDRYRFLGNTGFVSDDTEQAVMLAESIIEGGFDPQRAARIFGRKLRGWFWTIPPGIGLSTAKACLKLTVGLPSGISSAGNGAAMRAAPAGLAAVDPEALSVALAQVTHTDPRGVEGAVAVAHAVSRLVRGGTCRREDLPTLESPLGKCLDKAWELTQQKLAFDDIADQLGTTGYVLHTVPLAFAALWSEPETFLEGLQVVIMQGGDADSNAAVAGALLGARFGAESIPAELVERLEASHNRARLERLARQLIEGRGEVSRPSSMLLRWRELQVKFGVGLHVLWRLVP